MDFRDSDYFYIVYIEGRDGLKMYVNNERHWTAQNGYITPTQIDLTCKVPLLFTKFEIAKAIARAINGKVRRVLVGEAVDAVDL